MEISGTRRNALMTGLGVAVAAVLPTAAATADAASPMAGASGIEGQRKPDFGNGLYQNPVLAGDHPDPSILRDGDVYYKVSSSFDYYPGLVLWRSGDLVNWTPIGPTLFKPVGSVLAPDLAKHQGRYFIYFAVVNIDMEDTGAINFAGPRPYGNYPLITNYVIHADRIQGPWSDPIDLDLQQIDPGHGVGEDGKRYLFLADGHRVRLTDDGLACAGKLEKVWDGWPIPVDWVYESFALEGPKFMRRGEWFYLFAAEGGTAGPPTSHMVVVARSRSVDGPWENCPHNPIVHTQSPAEPWWSRGHATPVEGPRGDWWLVYHGYENGFRTLGRQMLLEPMAWTADGWPTALGGDLSKPLRKPLPASHAPHGMPFSDDFAADHLGTRLRVFMPGPDYPQQAVVAEGRLRLTASGAKPRDATLLVMNSSDHSYSVTAELEVGQGATGGLLLFYNKRAFCGLATDGQRLIPYRLGGPASFLSVGHAVGSHCFIRAINRDNVVSFLVGLTGSDWRMICSMEVAGYNHNVFDGFLSLRPAIMAMGAGHVDFRSLVYAAV